MLPMRKVPAAMLLLVATALPMETDTPSTSCLLRAKNEYYRTTLVSVYPGFGEAFEDRIAHFDLLKMGRASPGNIAYELTRSSTDEKQYRFFERWESLEFAEKWNATQQQVLQKDTTLNFLTNGTWLSSGYYPVPDSTCREYVQGGFNVDVEASCGQVWGVVTDYDNDCTWIQGCVSVSVDPHNRNLRNLTMENGNVIVQELKYYDDERLVYEYLSGALVSGFKGTVSIAESIVPGKGCLVGLLFELPKEGNWQSSVEAVYQYQQAVTIDYIENLFAKKEPQVPILTVCEIKTGYKRNKELAALYGDFAAVVERIKKQESDEYIENRLRSLAHAWLHIIEDPSRNAEPVKDILAPEFSLGLGGQNVTTFSEFETWLHGPADAVSASTHLVSDFKVTRLQRNTYEVTMVLSWNGLLRSNGVHMIAQTSHKWRVINARDDPYARIVKMEVETLVPFAPVD